MTLGGLRLVHHRHPRYGGMQVGFRELTAWSFLMASAHGAGLMVLPLLVRATDGSAHAHATHLTGLLALLVYWKLGLRMLRTVWINLDLIWGGALVVTGVVALVA